MKIRREKNNFNKGDLRRQIYDLFEQSDRKPLNHKQISAALNITDSGVRTLIYTILQEETEQGKLNEIERGKFLLVEIGRAHV
jgi:Fe2+ or Zn2+ uptake regulation protein